MTNKKLTPYLYILPSVLILAVFIYYPVIQNLQSGFFSWSPFSSKKDFVGFDNYTRLFGDSVFYIALKNTLLHAGFSLVFQVLGGLMLAAILEDALFRKISPILRTVYFLPVMISVSVIGLLFGFIYNPQIGLLNKLLELIGLGQYATGWLGNSSTAIYAVIAMSQWQGIGYITMLFIVAIQKIPQELYEASKIDGCSKTQAFWYITVPQVKEMMFVTTVFVISQSFLTFADVYVLTNGGPGNSSQVLSTFLYQRAFVDNEMGYASSIANVILAITFLFYMLQTKLFKTGKEE
ncbi:raffinose/stachyose/melibiose transport system permease protein [Paenibacillus sp. UNCCL117]|uniref:carbohydrate ABC transporter permease n=1 Tax=unclassified Paenibacillus TaxID=185978 RepID=UPI00087FFA15|nr:MULTISPECIES: sugar ABC transporter permease [unclassified Paenibacillus]SDE23143.1 raffinose/stachyose/melibiose transport system permease protein [Paenibacillus sp. cl123]SFW42706.1 raffinose/stachyose/melibiose transport system permease protein [Paenibacillus sp. UNCCL117]